MHYVHFLQGAACIFFDYLRLDWGLSLTFDPLRLNFSTLKRENYEFALPRYGHPGISMILRGEFQCKIAEDVKFKLTLFDPLRPSNGFSSRNASNAIL